MSILFLHIIHINEKGRGVRDLGQLFSFAGKLPLSKTAAKCKCKKLHKTSNNAGLLPILTPSENNK